MILMPPTLLIIETIHRGVICVVENMLYKVGSYLSNHQIGKGSAKFDLAG